MTSQSLVLRITRSAPASPLTQVLAYMERVHFLPTCDQLRRDGGQRGHPPQAALSRWHLEGRQYGILKFGRFWQIAICIADSDILHPLVSLNTPPVLRPHRQLSMVHDSTQSSVYTKKLTLLTRLIIHLL